MCGAVIAERRSVPCNSSTLRFLTNGRGVLSNVSDFSDPLPMSLLGIPFVRVQGMKSGLVVSSLRRGIFLSPNGSFFYQMNDFFVIFLSEVQ